MWLSQANLAHELEAKFRKLNPAVAHLHVAAFGSPLSCPKRSSSFFPALPTAAHFYFTSYSKQILRYSLLSRYIEQYLATITIICPSRHSSALTKIMPLLFSCSFWADYMQGFLSRFYRKMMINQDTACMFACSYDNKGEHLPAHSAKPAIFQ